MTKNNNYFTKAVNFFKQKDFEKALFFFNLQIKINPTHFVSYYFIGKIHFLQRNYNIALNYFTVCYKSEDNNDYYNLYLGKTYLALKMYNQAMPFLKKYRLKNKDGNFYLGLLYYNLNNFNESVNYFNQCPDVFFGKRLFKLSFSASLFNLANQFYIKNDIPSAEKLFLESVKINEEAYPAYFQLGMIYLSKKNYFESKKYFEALYKLFKKNDSIKIALAYIYNATNELPKLEMILKEIEQKNFHPKMEYPEFGKILAYTLFRQKKYKEAIPIFIQLYNKNNYDENTLFYLAQARLHTGDIDKAINICNLIFRVTSKNILINNFYLLTLIQAEKFETASSKSLEFIKDKVYDNKTVLFFYYSSIMAGTKIDFKLYFNNLKKVYENNPMFIEATANFYLKKEDYNKAIYFFYKLHSIQPDDSHTISKLIEIFTEKNLHKNALFYAKKLYSLNPENEQAIFYYAYYLIREGYFNSATKVLLQIKHEKDKAYHLLSELFFRKKDDKRGFYFLKKSFELNPLFLPIQFKSLVYFYKNKNFLQALRICKLMEFTNSSFKRTMVYEALIYSKKNRYDLAVNRLEKYLLENKEKSNPYVKYMLAVAYYCLGMTDQTKKLILHLIKINKTQAPYLVMLALCYKRKFQTQAIKNVEKLLKEKFNDTPSYLDYKSKYINVEDRKFFRRNDLGVGVPFI